MIRLALLGAALLALVVCVGGCGGSGSGSGSGSGTDRPATYKITVNKWPKVEDEKQVAGFLESAWRDPAGPIDVAVNTRLASETGSPMYNAQLAQVQTSKIPGYRERGLKREKINGRPVVHWAFDLANEESRVEYFFEECGTLFILRGEIGSGASFEVYANDFLGFTASIKANCNE